MNSDQAVRWATRLPIPMPPKMALVALATLIDKDGAAAPRVTELCELASASDRGVRQAIGDLEFNGLITVERNPPQPSKITLCVGVALKEWRFRSNRGDLTLKTPRSGPKEELWTPSWLEDKSADPANGAGGALARIGHPPPPIVPREAGGDPANGAVNDNSSDQPNPAATALLVQGQGPTGTLQNAAYPASGAGPCTGVLCLTVPKKGTRKASTKNTQVAREGDPAGFAGFYDRYPRKVGRRAAIRAWLAATQRGATLSMLLAALDGQRLELRERRFIPHPATWLNRDGWLDEPDRPDDGPRLDPRNLTGFAALAYRAQREAEEHREQAAVAS